MNILEEAGNLINGYRQETYGDAPEEFAKVAAAWSIYLGHELTAGDFVNMMIMLKTIRAKNGYHRDSYVDICGYSALAERVNGTPKREPRVVALLTEDCRGSEWIRKSSGIRYKFTNGAWYFDLAPIYQTSPANKGATHMDTTQARNDAIRQITNRWYTEDAKQREAAARADLVARVRERISNEFWGDLPDQVLPGANFGPAFDTMASEAVDVFVEFLRNPPARQD